VYLSSEGPRSTVLRVSLPASIRQAVSGEAVASPSSRDAAPSTSTVADPAETEPSGRDARPWLLGGLLGVAALVVLLRALRPR